MEFAMSITMLVVGVVVIFTLLLTAIIIILRKKPLKDLLRGSYGTYDNAKQNYQHCEITITNADDQQTSYNDTACPISESNRIFSEFYKDRRSTMPCTFDTRKLSTPKFHGYYSNQSSPTHSENVSTNSVNNDMNHLGGLITPVRRYSDNTTLTDNYKHSISSTINLDDRKYSYRPDRFSIISLNFNSLFDDSHNTKATNLSSYEILNLYGQGKLCFSVSFNEATSRLNVTINKAMYLNQYNNTSTNSSTSKLSMHLTGYYVKLYLINKDKYNVLQKHKTEIVTATKNPMFEQSFSFMMAKNLLEKVALKMVVKQSMLKKSQVLGGFVFDLTHDIIDKPNLYMEIWRDINNEKKTKLTQGELLVSLKHNDRDNPGILTVVIMHGKNIQVRPNDNSVFIRCTLLNGDQPISSRRSHTVKSNIAFPYFNYEASFKTDQQLPISNLGVIIHVCSRSKIGFSHLVGKVVIGSLIYTDNPVSLEHWTDIELYPMRSIIKWHNLV